MRWFIIHHFSGALCGAIFFARLGDVMTTRLATPTLLLEANPVAKKLGWWYAIATIFTCFIAFYSLALGFLLLGVSLCVSASNASKIWLMRTMGEEAFRSLSIDVIRRSGLASAIFFSCLPALFYMFLGLTIGFLDYDPPTWGLYVGAGIFYFGIVILAFYPWKIYRLSKAGQKQSAG